MNLPSISLLLLLFATVSTSQAQDADSVPVADQLQQLKRQVIALNRDLFVLEEDLLFPSSTQLVVYLSMDVGTYLDLDSVELKINNETVNHYLYTEKQTKALYRGGVQRLHVGNIAQGDHQISAFFTGIGPQQREYKRGVSAKFNKDADAKLIELSIKDDSSKQQPEFSVIEL
jgi:hypothetical protein